MANPYTDLMSSVGMALHAWSQVESGMGQLFWHVSGASDLQKAEAIFDTVVSFETRIAILDAVIACEEGMTDEEKRIWFKLSARLRKLYKKRHEVAHFGVDVQSIVDGTGIMPFFTWGKDRARTNKTLTNQQILLRAGIFTESCKAVGWFTGLLMRKKLPLLEGALPLEEPDLIVRIREQLAQTQEGQSPQPGLELE